MLQYIWLNWVFVKNKKAKYQNPLPIFFYRGNDPFHWCHVSSDSSHFSSWTACEHFGECEGFIFLFLHILMSGRKEGLYPTLQPQIVIADYEIFSVFGLRHRTNNVSEALHSKMSKSMLTHPGFWRFLEERQQHLS